MVACGMTQDKKSACLYISREVLETAKRSGLNLSRVSENALVEAIGRLQGPEAGSGPAAASGRLVRGVGFEPTNPTGWAP